jgi:serine/threonine-protein kinase
VQTIDVVSARGELFVVMEYVHGESLGDLMDLAQTRGEPVSPALAATLVVGVLRGLHAAHEATGGDGQALEIVHRDVSPQNILVGVDGTVRVLDFGVAKAAVRLAATRDGRIRGKLAYMAPEQFRGHATRASDVYACSVVLWELLSGERLFGGERDTDVIEAALVREIEPPSAARASRGEDSREDDETRLLDSVVMRGLARDPDARFATARDMASALERTMPAAPAEAVGAWVERLGGASLKAKAERIDRVEALSAARARKVGGRESRLLHAPSVGRRRAIAVTAAGVAAATAYVLARSSAPSARVDGATAYALVPPSAALPPSPVADLPPEGLPSSSPPSASRRIPVLPSARAGSRVATAPGVAPVRRPSACDPPFTFDDAGRKLYKESCLR